VENEEIILKSFGLTEYEARAYLNLLKLGTSTAEQLSEVGNIPLPRVYDTITELQKKGFVLVNKSRPKKFRAISPDKSLSNFIEFRKKSYEEELREFKGKVISLIKTLSDIQPVKMIDDKKKGIWSIEKRKNVQKILEEQETNAADEILIFAGDMSWFSERARILKNLIKRGITVRILCSLEKETDEIIKRARSFGIVVKNGYSGDLRGEIVDGKVALVALKTGQSKEDKYDNYELLIIENPDIVNTCRDNFRFWWEKLK